MVNSPPPPSPPSGLAAPSARAAVVPTKMADDRRGNGRVQPTTSAPARVGPADETVKFSPPEGDGSRAGRRYCIITPCRDEQGYAEVTLASVAGQTEPPALWVIVDDGSTDRTPQILRDWQTRLPYLRVISRADRGQRRLGGGVIDAFYDGYAAINPAEFDYVCKMDLDLEIPPTYFADVMNIMAGYERLGTFSGKPYFRRGERLISEMCGDENAVGMIKFYRVAAFEQIGGFVRELMWDGIDGHRCRMLGWRAQSRDDPRLRFIHLRPMGTSHKSWWTGRQRHGRGQFFMGTGPLYMLASAVYRMTRPPRVIGGVAMFWGYVKSLMTGTRRYEDPEFRRFLRRYQWQCLLMGKARATRKIDAEQAAAFRPQASPTPR